MSAIEFIGRDEEMAFLTEWVADKNAPSIVYFHDATEEEEKKGGIGKTWLLRNFYDIVGQKHNHIIPVSIDFFSILDRDSVTIAERIVREVKKRFPHWSIEDFDSSLLKYRQEVANKYIFRERLTDALVNGLRHLQPQMIKNQTYLLLFFDTYELIEYNPIIAVLRSADSFPDMYQSSQVRAIIAGRNTIDWKHQNWIGREKEVITRSLPPFNFKETVQYLKDRLDLYEVDSLPPQTLQMLYQKTEGRPILLGLVTDVLNKRIETLETLVTVDTPRFEASLVEEINHFENPSQWVILAMAHVHHRFDATFLERLMGWPGLKGIVPQIEYQELARDLSTLSFMRGSSLGDDFVLHDEMRRLVNKYCWETQDQDGRIRRELSRLAVDYYDELISQEKNQEKRQSYIVEKLFYELFLDVDEGFQSFEQIFGQAIDLASRAFARSLLQELLRFKPQLSHDQCQAAKLAEIKVLIEEENPQAALRILSSLEQDIAWAERHRSDLLFQKGICHLRLSEYPESIACFEAALELARLGRDKIRQALLLNRLGYIHRLQGQYNEAMHYYEEALKVQRNLDDQGEYANLLNNMGNVLRYQGNLEGALLYCKSALRIRRDLARQNKISEYHVGLSLSTLGHIYHTLGELKEEEKMYQEAFDIYNRVRDKSSIADAYNCLGRVWMQKEDLKKARENFQQALRIASGELPETELESYNQLGRILLSQKQWKDAIDLFEKAVALARRVGTEFQLAENLLYLAEALDQLEQPSREQIKEAKLIARKNNYSYLLARASELQGDMYLRREEYQSAFKHYRVACRYMAQRGNPEFNKILRKVNDLLFEIPDSFLPGAIDLLLSYWLELELSEKYPELPKICREVSRHMLL